MASSATILHNKYFVLGLLLQCLSLGMMSDADLHFLQTFIALIYGALVKFRVKGVDKLPFKILFLLLLLLSSYSMAYAYRMVFPMEGWFQLLSALHYLTFLLLAISAGYRIPDKLLHLLYFLLGTAFFVHITYCCYLYMAWPTASLLTLVLGYGLPVFIPLFVMYYTYRWLQRHRQYLRSFNAGIAAMWLPAVLLIALWWYGLARVEQLNNSSVQGHHQKAKPGALLDELVKSGDIVAMQVVRASLLYKTHYFNIDAEEIASCNESRYYHPLVALASFVAGAPNLSTEQAQVFYTYFKLQSEQINSPPYSACQASAALAGWLLPLLILLLMLMIEKGYQGLTLRAQWMALAMPIKQKIAKTGEPLLGEPAFYAGLLLIAILITMLVRSQGNPIRVEDDAGVTIIFLLHAGVLAYGIYLFVIGRQRRQLWLLFLVQYLLVGLLLNQSKKLLGEPVWWLTAWLGLHAMAMLAFCFYRWISPHIKKVLFFILGSGLPLYGYLCVVLLPQWGDGIKYMLLIGTGIYVFMPLFFIYQGLALIQYGLREDRRLMGPVLAGAAVPLLLLIPFLLMWQLALGPLQSRLQQHQQQLDPLPLAFGAMMQQAQDNMMSRYLIEVCMQYDLYHPQKGMFEARGFHDPAVALASFILGAPLLPENSQAAYYQIINQKSIPSVLSPPIQKMRVSTRIRLFLKQHIAFTEKNISFEARPVDSADSRQFFAELKLPQRAVVSDFRKIIHGQYKDSCWQQVAEAPPMPVQKCGNGTIRWVADSLVIMHLSFCDPQKSQNNSVRIGIVSQLDVAGEELIYKDAYFTKAPAMQFDESIEVEIADEPAWDKKLPGFEQISVSPAIYRSQHTYQKGLQLSFTVRDFYATHFHLPDGQVYYASRARGEDIRMALYAKEHPDPTREVDRHLATLLLQQQVREAQAATDFKVQIPRLLQMVKKSVTGVTPLSSLHIAPYLNNFSPLANGSASLYASVAYKVWNSLLLLTACLLWGWQLRRYLRERQARKT